jgi:hypothetical protein
LDPDPLFVNLGGTPPDFDTIPSSPVIDAGSTSLNCSVGWCDPNGSSPDSIYGSTDFFGNRRTHGSKIDIGAYENTGVEIPSSLTVNLTAGKYTLLANQTTTLRVTVAVTPGGGGVPRGTVDFMIGTTLLKQRALVPLSATESAATLPLTSSQLKEGANTLTAVYSGNSIAPCCPVSGPPAQVYPSTTSTPIIVTKR